MQSKNIYNNIDITAVGEKEKKKLQSDEMRVRFYSLFLLLSTIIYFF